MRDLTTRLTSYLYKKENVRKYLSAFQTLFDDLEETIRVMKEERWVDTANGQQLDLIGTILKETRNGQEDEEYRERLKFKTFLLRSSGTISDISNAVSLLTNPSVIHLHESYPLSYTVFSDGLEAPPDIGDSLRAMSMAGVGVSAFVSSFGYDPFYLSGTGGKTYLQVNDARFKVNGDKLTVSTNTVLPSGSYLSGISNPKLVNESSERILINGMRLRLNTPVNSVIIETKFKLTGAFVI